jgi:hypothetical protein
LQKVMPADQEARRDSDLNAALQYPLGIDAASLPCHRQLNKRRPVGKRQELGLSDNHLAKWQTTVSSTRITQEPH